MIIYENIEIIYKVKDLDDAILYCRGINAPVKKYNLIEKKRYKNYLLLINDKIYTLLSV